MNKQDQQSTAISIKAESTRQRLTLLSSTLLLAVGLAYTTADASEYDTNNSQPGFVSTLQDNLRFTIDLSARSVDLTRQNTTGYQYDIGFDIHKVFSSDTQDIAVLTAQGYFTQLNNMIAHPGFFQDKDDIEFVYRVFDINYLGLGGDLPNIRVGHFIIPYGLEHTITTNGTLRQYGQPRNLGIKVDWGVSLNKQFTDYEYEVSYTTGGNQSLDSSDGSYVVAARVGTPRDENTVAGLAVYQSRLNGLERYRIGADFKYFWQRHGLFSEISVGENEDDEVLNGLVEWNYRNRNESLLGYVQLAYFSQEISHNREHASQGIVGLKYAPDNHWTFSTQYDKDLNTFSGEDTQAKFSQQIRYRL